MEQRLTLIDKVSRPQYAEGNPLVLEACALYLDNIGHQNIAQLKWKNISSKTINSVIVGIQGYDAFNHPVAQVDHQYDRLDVADGGIIGNKDAIILNSDKVSRYDVQLKAIAYADGTYWKADVPETVKHLPAVKPFELPDDLMKQYNYDIAQKLTVTVKGQLQCAEGLWQCVCGSWQPEGAACSACHSTYEMLHAMADEETLKAHLQERLEKAEERRKNDIYAAANNAMCGFQSSVLEKALELFKSIPGWKDADEKAEECEKKIADLKQKELWAKREKEKQEEQARWAAIRRAKRRKIICIVMVILVALGCAMYFYGIPKLKYLQAVDKVEKGQYSAAAADFEALEDFEDAAERVIYTDLRAQEADLKTTTQQDKLVALAKKYAEKSDYFDCADRAQALVARADEIVSVLYAEVDALIAEGKCVEAKAILAAFGTYGNEQVQAKYYAVGEKYAADGKWYDAIATFENLGFYRDAAERAEYCEIRKYEDILDQTAQQDSWIAMANRYKAMGEYLDCAERAKALTDRADEIVTARYAEVDKLIAEGKCAEAEKILAAFGTYGNEQVQAKYYASAEKYSADSKWDEAIAAFRKAGNHGDAVKATTYCAIRKEENSLTGTTGQDKVLAVAKRYTTMGEYLDCPDRAKALTDRADEIVTARYAEVDKLIAEGKCVEAEKILAAFGTYGNEQVQAKYYAAAEKYLADGKWDEASVAFANLGDYSDASERIYEPYYRQGEALIAAGKWDEASAAFKKAGSYSDASKRITYCGIRKLEDSLANTTKQDSLIGAANSYTAMGEYLDCIDRAKTLTDRADEIVAARYAEVDKLIAEGKCAEAEKILAAFGTYGNEQVQAKYYAAAQKHFADSKWDAAIAAFKKAGNYGDAAQGATYCGIRKAEDALGETTDQDKVLAVAKRYNDMGKYLDCSDRVKALFTRADEIVAARYAEVDKLITEGKCAEAEKILAAFGTYGNAQVQEKYYAAAEKYLADGKWDEASAAFKKLGNYSDAAERILEPYYRQGDALIADGQWSEAIAVFGKIKDYSDAATRIKYCFIRKDEDALSDSTKQDNLIAIAKRYTDFGEYLDCTNRAKALTARADEIVAARYAEVDKLVANGKCAEAEKVLAAFGTYGNSQLKAKRFAIAERYYADKKYVEAYELFVSLGTYNGSKAKANSFYSDYLKDAFKRAKVGSYVRFGEFEQDNRTSNGKETIEWLVLAKEQDRMLVISRFILTHRPFQSSKKILPRAGSVKATWSSCELRKWLNGDFYDNAFNKEEKALILKTKVTADKNPYYPKLSQGSSTTDRVFLLSVTEVERYFSTDVYYAPKAGKTDYAYSQDQYSTGIWWTRTLSYETGYGQAAGYLAWHTLTADNPGTRPAMWVSLK